jgi:histidinol-phosphate/aromatic aminotransferase/cobyric acid decarboxylase-like protein
LSEYEDCRKKYIIETVFFLNQLNELKNIKILPSKANFVLIELLNGLTSEDVSLDLLINHGVYVRDCSDKIGLDGEYIRVAARSFEENKQILEALKHIK